MIDKYLHGQNPTKTDLFFTYLGGFLGGLTVLYLYRNNGYTWWQLSILFLISVDIFGGIISNLSFSTNKFYYSKPRLQILFLVVHFVHILALTMTFNMNILSLSIFFIYLLGSSVVVILLQKKDFQKYLAVGLVIIGTLFSTFYIVSPFAWFYPIFLLKLVYAFSVKQIQS